MAMNIIKNNTIPIEVKHCNGLVREMLSHW